MEPELDASEFNEHFVLDRNGGSIQDLDKRIWELTSQKNKLEAKNEELQRILKIFETRNDKLTESMKALESTKQTLESKLRAAFDRNNELQVLNDHLDELLSIEKEKIAIHLNASGNRTTLSKQS